MKSTYNLSATNLITACQKPGCPICRLQQEAVAQYLKDLFETPYHETDIRALLRDVKGFCKEHGRLVTQLGLGNTFGTTIIYHDLLWTALDELQKFYNFPSKKRPISLVERILLGLGFHRVAVTKGCVLYPAQPVWNKRHQLIPLSECWFHI